MRLRERQISQGTTAGTCSAAEPKPGLQPRRSRTRGACTLGTPSLVPSGMCRHTRCSRCCIDAAVHCRHRTAAVVLPDRCAEGIARRGGHRRQLPLSLVTLSSVRLEETTDQAQVYSCDFCVSTVDTGLRGTTAAVL